MVIIRDIRRFKATGALPCGPSQLDQDPLFWDALDVSDSIHAKLVQLNTREGA